MTIPADKESGFRARYAEYGRTLDCIHCGLCIPDCPTHAVTGKEASSPRGRIYLMRGYAEGSLDITPEVERHLSECIVCRACETICPSGIHMGEMMEAFRSELLTVRPKKGIAWRLSRFLLRRVLPHRARIAVLTDLLWCAQVLRLDRAFSAILRRAGGRWGALADLRPSVPHPRERRIETESDHPVWPAEGKARMRVGLFLGCIASEWFAPIHRATIRVLQKNGCDVILPDGQTCCGALHRHAGILDEADALYRRSREAFRDRGLDAIVVNAAGCGAALKEPPHDLTDGLGAPVRDVCELLDEIGIVEPTESIPRRVAYDQPCHLLHGQKIGKEVVENLLRRIPELDLVPLPGSDRCCGSGGVYNLVHPELAAAVRDEKTAAILSVRPDIVVTGNPGCAMQIAAGLRGTGIEVTHPVELLDRAYASPNAPSSPLPSH